MFDRSLEKSDLYFAVLQILRIMGEWISESVKDLEHQKEDWSEFGRFDAPDYLSAKYLETDREVINSNWDLLASHHAKLVKVLQDRIDRKTKEVESLRDGVIFHMTKITPVLSHANLHSSLTQLKCAKLREPLELASIYLSSL
jgi:hypothetical protein